MVKPTGDAQIFEVMIHQGHIIKGLGHPVRRMEMNPHVKNDIIEGAGFKLIFKKKAAEFCLNAVSRR